MKYLALYRKYRPSKFEEVAGQNNVISVLKNAVENNKISHAYLFFGPRGTGKTTTAKLLAKMVNCLNPIMGEPCDKCTSCISIMSNTNEDIIEIDAASNNGVDEIRELRDKINLVPANSNYKVYIIDEVHMLTTGAFNALLKTLEEPPKHIIFILATTEIYKIPLTISSRCQKFMFYKISIDDIFKRLREICNIEEIIVEDSVLKEIARVSDGGMRDAINLLDQLVGYKGNNINLTDVYDLSGIVSFDVITKILLEIKEKNVSTIIEELENVDKQGKNINKFIEEIICFLKDVLIYTCTGQSEYDNKKLDNIAKIGNCYREEDIYYCINTLNGVLIDIKNSNFSLILLEICMIKIVNYISNKTVETLPKVSIKTEINNKIDKKNVNESITTVEKNKSNDNKEVKIEKKEEYASNFKEIRINNAFYDANKKQLQDFKLKWANIFEFLTEDKYAFIVGLMKDIEIGVVGSKNIIFYSKYPSVCDGLNTKNCLVSELLNEIYKIWYNVIFISVDEWLFEKKKYINNLQKNYKYEYIIEEKIEEKKVITENEVSELIDILGEDVIEYK